MAPTAGLGDASGSRTGADVEVGHAETNDRAEQGSGGMATHASAWWLQLSTQSTYRGCSREQDTKHNGLGVVDCVDDDEGQLRYVGYAPAVLRWLLSLDIGRCLIVCSFACACVLTAASFVRRFGLHCGGGTTVCHFVLDQSLSSLRREVSVAVILECDSQQFLIRERTRTGSCTSSMICWRCRRRCANKRRPGLLMLPSVRRSSMKRSAHAVGQADE